MNRRNQGRSRRFGQAVAGVDLSGSYFKANFQAANVTKNGSDYIGTLNDLSGNARHCVNAGADTTKALWQSAGLNGQDVALLDGTGALARSVAKTGLAADSALARTIAVVYKVDAASSAGAFCNFIFHVSAGGSGGFSLELFTTTATRRLRFIQSATFTNSSCTFGNATIGGGYEVLIVGMSASADDAAATVVAEVNGANVATVGTANFSTVDANSTLRIGTNGATGSPIFSMAYIEDWSRLLDAPSRLQLARNLGSTYGITVA